MKRYTTFKIEDLTPPNSYGRLNGARFSPLV